MLNFDVKTLGPLLPVVRLGSMPSVPTMPNARNSGRDNSYLKSLYDIRKIMRQKAVSRSRTPKASSETILRLRAVTLCLLVLSSPTAANANTTQNADTPHQSPRMSVGIDLRTKGVMNFIGGLEAPRGYNDFFGGVSSPPPKQLTTMTINDVLSWQDAIDPHSKSEAAGRYQIMEDTLRMLKGRMKLTGDELFDIGMQDRLALELMTMAGWHPDREDHTTVANSLAKIWAALPLVSGPNEGRSAYHGLAGNKALTTPELYLDVLRRGQDASIVEAALKNSGRAVHARLDAPVKVEEPRSDKSGGTKAVQLKRQRPTAFDATLIEGGRLAPSQVLVFVNDPFAMD